MNFLIYILIFCCFTDYCNVCNFVYHLDGFKDTCTHGSLISESSKTTQKKESYSKLRKRKSREQINQLKNGILLIRLKTSENKIAALKKVGKADRAEKVKLAVELENKKIIVAFKNNFTFCKTAFFFSNDAVNIRKKLFNNIFLNDSLKIDPSIKIDSLQSIFIADFGSIEKDTIIRFSHYSYENDGNFNLAKTANYYSSSTELDIYALKILDANFIQLNKPFPFYTRITGKAVSENPEQSFLVFPLNLLMKGSYDRTIYKMNRKFYKYYNKNKI